MRANVTVIARTLRGAISMAVAHLLRTLRTSARAVEFWLLHLPRPLPIRTRPGRMELPRPTLRTACAEIVAELARRKSLGPHRWPFAAPIVHARAHRHRPVRTCFAVTHSAIPRCALVAPFEIRTGTALPKTRIAVARWRALMLATPLRLRTIAGRGSLRSILLRRHVAMRRWLGGIVTRRVARSPRVARSIDTATALALAIARAIGTWTARLIAVPPHFSRWSLRTITIAARTFGPLSFLASFPASLRTLGVARRPHFVRSDAAVAIAVELAEDIARVCEFLVVDRAVAVGIERAKDARHRAIGAAAASDSAFAARSSFALRRMWRSRLIFLREERTRRERERHRGGECLVSFHGFGLVELGGCCRGVRRAFIRQNAARAGFCLRLRNIYTMHRWR